MYRQMYLSQLNKKSCTNHVSSENSFDVELRPTPGYERIRYGVGCNGDRRNGDVSYVRSVTPSRVMRDLVTSRVLQCEMETLFKKVRDKATWYAEHFHGMRRTLTRMV